ncbi:hypothetical protein [Falsibacillus albus]|uniref:Tetratricopeptide repeat protein n=1 Tax=Falsibacillus albus TaxID=2478915 RepID=A0A3L7JQ56_9BACI|nr:hypothetical protein [Falsibacillus albus]RLQ92405.1 hypothetical protein D9X91_19340 [Falsibacillus albus]
MDIYEKFNELIASERNEEILNLLMEFEYSKKLTIEEKAWVFWNVSDILAMMRKPHQQYKNHSEFVKWGKKELPSEKLHWFASDATQALTLSLGNYFEEWYDWYLYACKHSSITEQNRGARFESHRTAIAALLKMNRLDALDFPLNQLFELIQEDKYWENNIFARLSYNIFLLEKAKKLQEEKMLTKTLEVIKSLIDDDIDAILNDETIKEEQDPCLLGSWEQLNSSRLTKRSMTIALNNLGCTLSRLGMYAESVKAFHLALQHNFRFNEYGLSLYLLSIWSCCKNSQKVVEEWNRYGTKFLSRKNIIRISPELQNVEWGSGA